MKKKMCIILIAMLAISVLAACGGSNGGGSGLSIKTLGDAFAATGEEGQFSWAYDESVFVYVFEKDGVTYRAIAKLSSDVYEKLMAIDIFDEDSDAQTEAALTDVEVQTFENLSDLIPSQEETNKIIGKTGAELFEDGWSYWYYDLAEMEAGMDHDIFSYNVKFNYDGPQLENTDDFDFYEAFKDLTVSEITCNGIGDATNAFETE